MRQKIKKTEREIAQKDIEIKKGGDKKERGERVRSQERKKDRRILARKKDQTRKKVRKRGKRYERK